MSEDKTGNAIEKPSIDFEKMDGLVPDRTGRRDRRGADARISEPRQLRKDAGVGIRHLLEPHPQKLWMKGETSGNRLRVVSASTDCDQDTLLFRVVVEGDGLVCHEAR